MSWQKAKSYAPIAVRYGVGIVFLLIGLDQLLKPQLWASYFPEWVTMFGNTIEQAVLFNGIFDTLVGFLLLIGLLTRIISAIATLHLIGIIYVLGYNDIAIRDLGILIASISIFLHGPDKWCLWPKEN